MNLVQIQELIKFVSKAGVSEVEIEQKDFKITIKTHEPEKKGKGPEVVQVVAPQAAVPHVAAPAPVAAPVAAPAPAASTLAPEPKGNLLEIKSPMIGTFYRAGGQDKPPFIEVGTTVKPGDTVCIVEAMKLFNEIECEISGKVVKVLVNDNTPVEYDQPLFLVEPA
ncbi:MAG: acetyl-CoA carboxylase biotin carboxyl carrier protein [Flavobacteriales bacterium]